MGRRVKKCDFNLLAYLDVFKNSNGDNFFLARCFNSLKNKGEIKICVAINSIKSTVFHYLSLAKFHLMQRYIAKIRFY